MRISVAFGSQPHVERERLPLPDQCRQRCRVRAADGRGDAADGRRRWLPSGGGGFGGAALFLLMPCTTCLSDVPRNQPPLPSTGHGGAARCRLLLQVLNALAEAGEDEARALAILKGEPLPPASLSEVNQGHEVVVPAWGWLRVLRHRLHLSASCWLVLAAGCWHID